VAKKKKSSSARVRAAVFFPDHGVYERIDLLASMMATELTIKIKVPGHVAVMQAIEEAIARREKTDGQPQS